MATAELAIVIPAVLLVLAMCLTGLALATDQVRCVDAARAGARAASRGEDPGEIKAMVLDLTPKGSSVTVHRTNKDTVEVRVVAPRRARLLPGLPRATSTARAPLEPVVYGGR